MFFTTFKEIYLSFLPLKLFEILKERFYIFLNFKKDIRFLLQYVKVEY